MSEPTIVFLLHANQWFNIISPITKLELLDWSLHAGCNFFLENNAYVLAVKISLWNTLDDELKRRFKIISRRVREELDGPFTDEMRNQLEEADPFEVFNKKEEKMESIPEDVINEDA